MFQETFVVTAADTAKQVGSGGLEVYATPVMVAHMEKVALEGLQAELEDGQSSVGIEINVKHVKATAVGKQVEVVAEIVGRHKRIISFEIEAKVDGELIGQAQHKRAIIDVESFMAGVLDD